MPRHLTPGVYFERPTPRETPSPQRTDVVGFVGLAERGPLHVPARISSWREYQQLFGGFLRYSYLAYGVRAFFENGGRACWVVRIADESRARSAAMKLMDKEKGEDGRVSYYVKASSPGTWGDKLAVSVQAARLAATHHVVMPPLPAQDEQDHFLAVGSITGFKKKSRVRLTQARQGGAISAVLRVKEVDVIRGFLRLEKLEEPPPDNASFTDFELADKERPISVESLEFTLLVWEAGRIVERFDALAPEEKHERFAPDIVNVQSRLIRLERGSGDALPHLPQREALERGVNGLRTLDIHDYLGTPQGDDYGLASLAKIDEVSLLVMPDLMVRPARPAPLHRAPRRKLDACALDTPTARVEVKGIVVDGETGAPLVGVEVEASDGLKIHRTESQADGSFVLKDLLPGNIELVLKLKGYEERVYRVGAQDAGEIALTPLDLPPELGHDDVYHAQAAMVAQCERLRDRFALLDPPLEGGKLLDVSDLQAWRARFDTAFAALYYPWLRVRDPLQPDAPRGRLVPPSGHVAGTYAATDLAEGVFRPPANRPLAFVDDVGAVIDDALQGVLNPQGINAIRGFPGRGIRVYGARTLSSDSAWRFVNVRRLLSMLEEALYDGLQWAVFEPNDKQLQLGLRLAIIGLLDPLWRRGAFVGDTAEAAYQVRCDATTTPPELRASGQIVAEVRVAPTVPYEFILLRLGLTADELRISEVDYGDR
jgi:uncharacterized protein